MTELTEHQQKTMIEIHQHLLDVRCSSQNFIESLLFFVADETKFKISRKNKFIVFSLDELRTLIQLIYKLFEVHEEV